MKNPIALVSFFICLSLNALVSACDLTPEGAGAPPAARVASALPSPRVRIVHIWTDHHDGAAYHHSEFGLGTAVGPSVILTHNHFDIPAERRENEALTLTTATGKTYTLRMVDVAAVAIDGGTQMIYLPSYVALPVAPVGDQTSLHQLAEGAWLEVDYWDDALQRFARGTFRIKHLERGVATLADPRCVVRPGDSGGGSYLAGKLIGNTWATYADPGNGRPTGAFNVALLPAEAMVLLRTEQTNQAIGLPADAGAMAGERQ